MGRDFVLLRKVICLGYNITNSVDRIIFFDILNLAFQFDDNNQVNVFLRILHIIKEDSQEDVVQMGDESVLTFTFKTNKGMKIMKQVLKQLFPIPFSNNQL